MTSCYYSSITCHSYLEHRASTKQLQCTLFRANTFNSPHVFPSLLASSSTLLLHEIRRLPIFLLALRVPKYGLLSQLSLSMFHICIIVQT